MPTPAPSQSGSSPSPSTPAPALDARLAEKLIGGWRRIYRLLKPLEARVDIARAKVLGVLVASGVQRFDSKHGTIGLQTRKTVNWEALARSVIEPKFVEQLVPQFTNESDPFIRAPASWSQDA